MAESSWVVHKFGGTSLADASRFRRVADVVDKNRGENTAVVVSAMAGVTNTLVRLVEHAGGRDETFRTGLDTLRRTHVAAIEDLVKGEDGEALEAMLEADLADIEDILHALWLLRGQSEGALDLISGYGELWSARLLATFLVSQGKRAACLDARDVLVVAPGELGSVVNWEASTKNLRTWLAERDLDIVVITGFIASTAEGIPTTLGRNGSDFSASIFGACLAATQITIWTDVDGVMSANPRLVPEAQVLDALSYHEAMELAYFGAKVVHPSTMTPAIEASIPIFIRNTFNPEHPGTRIHLRSAGASTVKGFATIDEMALINVEGTGMIGVPGIAHRLFGALRESGVSVVMISQGSSEHSICFAVPSNEGARARVAVERAFYAELHQGQIQTIDVEDDCAILAVVGDQMEGIPGVAATFFGALGKAGINIRAIAQGSSERNISVVIARKESVRALRAVHSGFYLSNQTISIGLIGPGNVGATFLAQLRAQIERLHENFRIDLRVRAIATSKKMVFDERHIELDDWQGALEADGEPVDLDAFAAHVQADFIPHAVIIDCTSSQAIADCYAKWLEAGVHVITPNKKANTSSYARYTELRQLGRSMRRHYLYETTVGAGLPIIHTLRDLIQTGDDIYSIEGILSGTLAYLFNSFDGSRPFSEILIDAKKMGYTEPDPRDDLSGMDVARKLVILAREMGLIIELDEVEVESLVPAALQASSVESFLAELPSYDAALQKRLDDARSRNEVLRFVGRVDKTGRATVSLRSYPETHAFARIQRTDNIVQFETSRYNQNPLVVQGPGAGPEVTAGGVFGDLLRLATYLGATL